jgi:signal transduction histidine kinase
MPKVTSVSSVFRRVSLRARIVVATTSAACLTLLVGFTSTISSGARTPAVHAAVETGATLTAVLAALLVYGRYSRALQRRDLMLTVGLAVFAVANFGLSTVPAIATSVPAIPMAWASVLSRVLGAALLAAAAFLPPDEVRRPTLAARRWFGGGVLAVVAVTTATVLAGDRLPAPVAQGAAAGQAFAGTPAIATLGAIIVLLFGAATLGFTRRAAGSGDALLGWLGLGSVFGTFAWLNYVIYPSVVTDWFAAGDLLRLGFFACLLAGGVTELRRGQRALAEAAVIEERQRMARDLHDGSAQDLAFIAHAARALRAGGDATAQLDQITIAAQHALENTRQAIADFACPSGEPLTLALARTAQDVAGRVGARVEVDGEADVQVPAATREALCRLVREAVTNAVRHGGATAVRITVRETPELRVVIGDDGCGFDPEAVGDPSPGFGLPGMQQRVKQLGGELRIDSEPGRGTEVLVRLP